jgi:FHA domain
MAMVLWTAVALYCVVSLIYVGFLAHGAARRVARGVHLDAILLRARLRCWSGLVLHAERLERRIVWRVLAAGVPDASQRCLWLPDTVAVMMAPRDLHRLGRAAECLGARVLERLEALERTRRCRFRARPVIAIADDPACPPGRPTLRLEFGEATQPAMPPGGTAQWGAHLRPMHPLGVPLRLRGERRFRIGRLHSSDLIIRQAAVSRRHAVVYEQNGAWYVADEGSTNGTFVNRAPVTAPVKLADADEIRLGDSVRLRFELQPPPWSRLRALRFPD